MVSWNVARWPRCLCLDKIAELLGHGSTRMLEAHDKHPVGAAFSGHVDHVVAIFG